MAYGRGGAGNIQAAEQQKTQIKEDVEANLQSVGPVTDRMAPSDQQYAYTGRGGAGNYYSPAELHQTGTFHDADRSHIVGDGTLAPTGDKQAASSVAGGEFTSPPQEPTRKYGRGGAGNFIFGSSESESKAAQKLEDDERKKEQISGVVEKGVEQILTMPPKAKVAVHANADPNDGDLV